MWGLHSYGNIDRFLIANADMAKTLTGAYLTSITYTSLMPTRLVNYIFIATETSLLQ